MKIIHVFWKQMREMRRDLLIVVLTLIAAPCFLLLYKMITNGGSTTFRVAVEIENSQAFADALPGGKEEMLGRLGGLRYGDGASMLRAIEVAGEAEGRKLLQNGGADAMLILPEEFPRAIKRIQAGSVESAPLRIVGNLSHPYYMIALTLSGGAVEAWVAGMTGRKALLTYQETPLGLSGAKSEFDIYVPGVLIVSVVMLIFFAAMTVTREVESGAMKRMRLSRATPFDLLGGISMSILALGAAAFAISLLTAALLGFHSAGSLFAGFLVGLLTILSVIGLGLIVACFSRTVMEAFVIANFPLIPMMFLSGAVFPLPKTVLFRLGPWPVGLFDFIPPVHAVSALGKIFTYGMGLGELPYELSALALLSVLYFAAGLWLFRRMKMS
jgi:ABC-2 type transport system permease protein